RQWETSGGKNMRNPVTGATGPVQYEPKWWKAQGYDKKYGDINDPEAQRRAFSDDFPRLKTRMQAILGRPVEDWEAGVAWNQGLTGALRLFKNPDAPAIQARGSTLAITGNGGKPHWTAAQFLQHRKGVWENAEKIVGGAGDYEPWAGEGQSADTPGAFQNISGQAGDIPGFQTPSAMGLDDIQRAMILRDKPASLKPESPPDYSQPPGEYSPSKQFAGGGQEAPEAASPAGLHDIKGQASDIPIYQIIDEESGGDPRIARTMKAIFEGESWHRPGRYPVNLRGEASYGPFQMNMQGGLGAQMLRQGIDPRDPSTVREQARWVANYLRSGGSTEPWRGYQRGLRNIQAGITHPYETAGTLGEGAPQPLPHRTDRFGISGRRAGEAQRHAAERDAAIEPYRRQAEEAVQQPLPAMPQLRTPETYDQWREKHNQTILSGSFPHILGAIIALAGLGVAIGTRGFHGSYRAMSGLNGFLQGLRQGDKHMADTGLRDYKSYMDQIAQENQNALTLYKLALNRQDIDIGRKMELLKIAASRYDDRKMHDAASRHDTDAIDKEMERRHKLINEQLDEAYKQLRNMKERFRFDEMQTEAARKANRPYEKEADRADKEYDRNMQELGKLSVLRAKAAAESNQKLMAEYDKLIEEAKQNAAAAHERAKAIRDAMQKGLPNPAVEPVAPPEASRKEGKALKTEPVGGDPWNRRVVEGEMPSGLPMPATPEEAESLPEGTRYVTPDGDVMVR
ncbi:MAG TPA: hypothetical protein VFF88_11245, partial [Methylocella sp.]|nr:hypothetical protein [Methylocella sp.]